MTWRQYENDVYQELLSLYPNAEVEFDTKVMGRFSKVLRQCDILIREKVGEREFLTLVDAKFHKRKLDVKAVEEFVGLLRDVNCDHGMIIASSGFTKAAENLAFYGSDCVDVDIFDYIDLQELQGVGAIPYSDDIAVLLRSPLGWVTDAAHRENMVCSFYRRGQSFNEALADRELMYLNFWHLKAGESIHDLIEHQENSMRVFYQNVGKIEISYSSYNAAKNHQLILRDVVFVGSDHMEITGYCQFGDCVLFVVLHTPLVRSDKNRRKLIRLISLALPMRVKK